MQKYVDYIVFHTSSNDNNTGVITVFTAFKTQLLQVAQTYSRKSNRLMFDTILPRTSTTDSCATYANQTKLSWEALRIQENNWLRGKTCTGAMAYFAANLKIGKVIAVNDPTIQMERKSDGTAVVLDSNGQQAAGAGGDFLIGNRTDCIHPNRRPFRRCCHPGGDDGVAAAVMMRALPTGGGLSSTVTELTGFGL